MLRWFVGMFALALCSCQDSGGEIERYDPAELEKEIAYDIEMIYSDSAIVEFRVQSPVLEKYTNEGVLVEEFPAGFLIEYFDEEQNVIFKLSSNYAKRVSEQGLLILRDSVTYVNEKNDILETNALTIDELNNSITTTKFFRLIQGPAKDTIYGRGFNANSDFTSFRVDKYVGKRRGIKP